MALELPVDGPLALLEEELERYWAVWQHPEGRYTYMVDFDATAYLVLLDTEEAGRMSLIEDAATNGRTMGQYRLDPLTLPEAFEAARAQPLPFLSSFGWPIEGILGVEIRTWSAFGTVLVSRIPL